MRNYTLRQAANRYLRLDNRGSFKSKKHRAYVIRKMIDGLFIIGNAPVDWHALRTQHIHALVAHWKSKKLSHGTIINYMSVIRAFLRGIDCLPSEISNQSLNIHRDKKKKRRKQPQAIVWQEWPEDIPRLIMALQTELGLTYKEAIRVKPGIHINENTVWVTRNIASNASDRTIPIRDEIQRQIYFELKKYTNGNNMIDHIGSDNIRLAWRCALRNRALPTDKSWRFLYAKKYYQYLLPIVGKYQACWIIRDEMGISSRNSLWRYLNE